MPKRPVSGAKMVSLELLPELVDAMKELAKRRGQSFKEEMTDAIRRHLAYPPPPLTPPTLPPVAPLPDTTADEPTAKPAPKKGKK